MQQQASVKTLCSVPSKMFDCLHQASEPSCLCKTPATQRHTVLCMRRRLTIIKQVTRSAYSTVTSNNQINKTKATQAGLMHFPGCAAAAVCKAVLRRSNSLREGYLCIAVAAGGRHGLCRLHARTLMGLKPVNHHCHRSNNMPCSKTVKSLHALQSPADVCCWV